MEADVVVNAGEFEKTCHASASLVDFGIVSQSLDFVSVNSLEHQLCRHLQLCKSADDLLMLLDTFGNEFHHCLPSLLQFFWFYHSLFPSSFSLSLQTTQTSLS